MFIAFAAAFLSSATPAAPPAPAAPAPVLAAAAAMQGPAVTRQFLLGRWTDTNDCTNYVDFLADGRFLLANGNTGRWSLQNGRLSFIGTSTVTAAIHASDANTIVLTHDDGSVGRSTRCGAAQAARRVPVPPLPATIDAAVAMSRPATRELLLGVWTDDGDCGNTISFLGDGRFTISNGGSGTWRLAGDRLTFTGASEITARARSVGRNRIILIHADGSLGQSIRC